jgi:serine/threonine protein kinase
MDEQLIAGRYRLLTELGRGAMSSVWLAEDTELARRVAVKMLAPTADRQRFEREARAVAALSHPHIAALYDYGQDAGRPYMVLEYLPGGSLEDRLRAASPLSEHAARTVAGEVAAGLAHAHERGLVHRDLKPANVLFDAEGRAKIVDFGIARARDAHTLTEAGTVLGTASTISPEQAAGEPAGPASDVYSFGVVLFRLLTGRLPFTSTNALELVRMHRDDPPPPVRSVRPDAPAELAALADAALAKDPARRPADGNALVRALEGREPATAVLMAPAEAETRVLPAAVPPQRRLRRAAALIALALALTGAGVAAALLAAGGGGNGPRVGTSLPSLSLPTVATAPSASSGLPPSTAASIPTTTKRATTTRAANTTPATPSVVTALPTTAATTALPTTTLPTTAPTTTALPTTAPASTTPSTTAPSTAATTTVTVP